MKFNFGFVLLLIGVVLFAFTAGYARNFFGVLTIVAYLAGFSGIILIILGIPEIKKAGEENVKWHAKLFKKMKHKCCR